MKNILSVGGYCTEVNALFIQPTFLCANSCKGCYVKAERKFHSSMDCNLFHDLLTTLLHGDKLSANQVTISFDHFHSGGLLESEVSIKSRLLYYYNTTQEALSGFREAHPNKVIPEFHGTFYSQGSYDNYRKFCFHKHEKEQLDLISLSNLSSNTYRPFTSESPKLNYNHMIPSNISSENIDEYIKEIDTIAKKVDSIYLIVFKDTSKMIRFPSQNLTRVREQLRHDVTVINTLFKRCAPETRKKLHVDGCLKDAIRYKKNGYGCSSNVSRFQVWPGGNVSGCPYKTRQTYLSSSVSDIIREINSERARYDFEETCYFSQL